MTKLVKITSILQILIGSTMLVYHLATLYPWYQYSMAVYATHNVFLVLADTILIALGLLGLLIGFQLIGSLQEHQKTTSFIHTGLSIFGIGSILFIVSTQGAVEFSLWNFYQTVLPYKLKSTMSGTTSVTDTMVNTFIYLDPSFAFMFSLILIVVWILSIVASIFNLKSCNSALFDGTGTPMRNVTIISASTNSMTDISDKESTVSYVAYPSVIKQ